MIAVGTAWQRSPQIVLFKSLACQPPEGWGATSIHTDRTSPRWLTVAVMGPGMDPVMQTISNSASATAIAADKMRQTCF